MALSDWLLEANEEAGQQKAQRIKKCSAKCTEQIAKKGLCNRYCRNGVCTVVQL